MKSILAKILLWMAGTIVLSLAGFEVTAWLLTPERPERVDLISRFQTLQLEQAREELERGGTAALAEYLRRLDRLFYAKHYLVDPEGRDLVDGTDRSERLHDAAAPPTRPPSPLTMAFRASTGQRPGPVVLATPPDGGPRLLIVMDARGGPQNFLPYYLWIVLVVLGLGYALALHFARPLRRLRRAVQRFGQGDLTARTGSARRDEFGEVSRAFDEMAGRIETLLSAERRLLQDVSHELRSPLARLGFAVELARTSPDRDVAADRIKRDVDRLSELVGGLLQLTRAEGDPAARCREAVSLNGLVEELADDCSIEAAAGDVRIDVRIEPPLSVCGDRELLRRAVENVLRNAVRHAPAGTAVEVALSEAAGVCSVTIRDYGPGVPEAALSAIFEPFVRVEEDRSRTNGGVGLGLAIAKRAVDLHGGKITAENATPGLVVRIEVPHSEDAAAEGSMPFAVCPSGALNP